MNDKGEVVKHVDKWDSIENNEYFSWEGVGDLVGMCGVGSGSRSVGRECWGEVVRRRRKEYEIWEIGDVGKDGFERWCVGDGGVVVEGGKERWGSLRSVGVVEVGKGVVNKGMREKCLVVYRGLAEILERDGVELRKGGREDGLFWIVKGENGVTEVWVEVEDY